MTRSPAAVVHLDESCLGNVRDGGTPGGAGGLIEVRTGRGIQRLDFALAEPATTNNRMALRGAAAVLDLLSGKGKRLRVLLVSDSEYLVRGMNEWVTGWKARGWRRKAGPVENLDLWQLVDTAAGRHDCQWAWVRGHHGHPKNEYADHLAVQAARTGAGTGGAVPSGFGEWLAARRADGQYLDYDPDAAFDNLARPLAAGQRVPLAADGRRAIPGGGGHV